jgi:hypothetical protein
MPLKLKNTERHFLEKNRDPELKKIMETYEEDGPSSKRYSWLIDTEILEINQRLRMRKEEVKLLMASISM